MNELWIVLGIVGYLFCAWLTVMIFIAVDGPMGNDEPLFYGATLFWPILLVIFVVYVFFRSAYELGRRIHENRHPEAVMRKDD